jgi:HAE1 family hydrophobic/amphiphilic exporter-1/multidrug efflux pump
MGQITGALVGIALVLAAVFVPMAIFGGSVGVIYRQFSITIVSSMALSVFVALTLTPALCATILKPVEKGHGLARKGFFGWFNRTYDRGARRYDGVVELLLRRRVRGMIGYGVLVVVLGLLFGRMSTGFLPNEDQGLMYAQIVLPPGSTLEMTRKSLEKISSHLLTEEKEAVGSVMSIVGFNFGSRGQNAGVAFVRLRPWEERHADRLRADAVAARVQRAFSTMKEANVFVFTPPAVTELGNANGFELQLQDRGNLGHDALMAARGKLLDLARKDPRLAKVRPSGLEDTPQFNVDVDQQKTTALGVSLADVNQTLASTWGVAYVNDFLDKGRTKRVYLQADAPYRMSPEDLNRWYVRNRQGEMVPFSAIATSRWTFGSPKLERFNGIPSIAIQGEPSAGHSSGEAMAAMESIAAQLPAGIGYEWSGLSYEERLSGANAPALYAISLLVVFLCLAALYESWSIPASVMLVVPLGVLGAVLATLGRGLANDVFFQVGLLTTVGLSAKNAILIVEFAKVLHERGKGIVEAAREAARMRLRPILMTSLAFVLGVLPLAIARGAGAGGQIAIGTAVIGGMLSATVLAILFVPLFFVLVARRSAPPPRQEPRDADADARAEEEEEARRVAAAARDTVHA